MITSKEKSVLYLQTTNDYSSEPSIIMTVPFKEPNEKPSINDECTRQIMKSQFSFSKRINQIKKSSTHELTNSFLTFIGEGACLPFATGGCDFII